MCYSGSQFIRAMGGICSYDAICGYVRSRVESERYVLYCTKSSRL